MWELAANYTGCMIGYHSVPVIVDAEQWRIDGWDHDLALEAMVQAADSMHLGWIPTPSWGTSPDHEHERVQNLNTFDDACISRYARSHGRPELAQVLAGVLFVEKPSQFGVRVHPRKDKGLGRRV